MALTIDDLKAQVVEINSSSESLTFKINIFLGDKIIPKEYYYNTQTIQNFDLQTLINSGTQELLKFVEIDMKRKALQQLENKILTIAEIKALQK